MQMACLPRKRGRPAQLQVPEQQHAEAAVNPSIVAIPHRSLLPVYLSGNQRHGCALPWWDPANGPTAAHQDLHRQNQFQWCEPYPVPSAQDDNRQLDGHCIAIVRTNSKQLHSVSYDNSEIAAKRVCTSPTQMQLQDVGALHPHQYQHLTQAHGCQAAASVLNEDQTSERADKQPSGTQSPTYPDLGCPLPEADAEDHDSAAAAAAAALLHMRLAGASSPTDKGPFRHQALESGSFSERKDAAGDHIQPTSQVDEAEEPLFPFVPRRSRSHLPRQRSSPSPVHLARLRLITQGNAPTAQHRHIIRPGPARANRAAAAAVAAAAAAADAEAQLAAAMQAAARLQPGCGAPLEERLPHPALWPPPRSNPAIEAQEAPAAAALAGNMGSSCRAASGGGSNGAEAVMQGLKLIPLQDMLQRPAGVRADSQLLPRLAFRALSETTLQTQQQGQQPERVSSRLGDCALAQRGRSAASTASDDSLQLPQHQMLRPHTLGATEEETCAVYKQTLGMDRTLGARPMPPAAKRPAAATPPPGAACLSPAALAPHGGPPHQQRRRPEQYQQPAQPPQPGAEPFDTAPPYSIQQQQQQQELQLRLQALGVSSPRGRGHPETSERALQGACREQEPEAIEQHQQWRQRRPSHEQVAGGGSEGDACPRQVGLSASGSICLKLPDGRLVYLPVATQEQQSRTSGGGGGRDSGRWSSCQQEEGLSHAYNHMQQQQQGWDVQLAPEPRTEQQQLLRHREGGAQQQHPQEGLLDHAQLERLAQLRRVLMRRESAAAVSSRGRSSGSGVWSGGHEGLLLQQQHLQQQRQQESVEEEEEQQLGPQQQQQHAEEREAHACLAVKRLAMAILQHRQQQHQQHQQGDGVAGYSHPDAGFCGLDMDSGRRGFPGYGTTKHHDHQHQHHGIDNGDCYGHEDQANQAAGASTFALQRLGLLKLQPVGHLQPQQQQLLLLAQQQQRQQQPLARWRSLDA